MKKSLVLAMAMALGVTASAYAANPFSDVPAGHWAYDSISKLAAAGVIEGYGDDTFRGDRLMTRYEMAQIVAKAMAKGANVDKLAAEFADELDALGVRVAALEKKSDNVKITGQFRWSYESSKLGEVKSHKHNLRTRMWFTGKVNDTWDYVGMLQNDHEVGQGSGVDTEAKEGTAFQRAYLQGRLGGVKVIAGRQDFAGVLFDNIIYGVRMDGIRLNYGSKFNLQGYFGKPTNAAARAVGVKPDKMYGVSLKGDFNKTIGAHVGWDAFKADKGANDADANILNAGLDFTFANDFKLGATYLHTNSDAAKALNASDNGFVVGLAYKGAKAAKPGSWGLGVKYYHAPGGVNVAGAWDSNTALHDLADQGFKGWHIMGNYAVAKNMVAQVSYYDLKGRLDDKKDKVLWTHFAVTF